MYRSVLLYAFFAFCACSSNNQRNSEKNNLLNEKNTVDQTEILFNEEIHDFGTLQAGEIVVFTFVFTNSGNSDLVIENVKTDCGCLQADFLKGHIAPGNSGNIEIEFNSSGLYGKQFKTFEVHANTKKSKQLAIFAEVQNKQIEIKY